MKWKMVCTTCHSVGYPKKKTRGSFLIELILWLCFILPGLIYTLWRVTSRYSACAACGGTNLLAAESMAGKKFMERNGITV